MELYGLQKDYAISYLEKLENATTEERATALSAFGEKPLDGIISRNDAGNEATIKISGPLSPAGPSPIARFFGFGGTGYIDIIAAIKSVEDDPTVDTVRLAMDTPGGTVAGMDQARQAIESLSTKKKVIAENHGMIASAGYYLATAANEIVAMSPLANTGSIGVIMAGLDFSDAMARNGVKRIKIVSKNAPNKQADPSTPHGAGVLQNEVDAMERVFIQKITEGRGTTEQDVIDNFGQGGMLIAQDPDSDKPDAVKVGMIDKVITNVAIEPALDDDEENNGITSNSDTINGNSDISETSAAEGGGQQQGAVMDLNQLKAEHPALVAQIEAQGVEKGVTQERERVDAHLTMGKSSGDMDLAMSCISEGTELTASVNAKYFAAGMNNQSIQSRASESENDLDTDASDDEESEDKVLATALADELGVDNHA